MSWTYNLPAAEVVWGKKKNRVTSRARIKDRRDGADDALGNGKGVGKGVGNGGQPRGPAALTSTLASPPGASTEPGVDTISATFTTTLTPLPTSSTTVPVATTTTLVPQIVESTTTTTIPPSSLLIYGPTPSPIIYSSPPILQTSAQITYTSPVTTATLSVLTTGISIPSVITSIPGTSNPSSISTISAISAKTSATPVSLGTTSLVTPTTFATSPSPVFLSATAKPSSDAAPNGPTSSSSVAAFEMTSTPTPQSRGLSQQAKIGIGLGVTFFVILAAIIVVFFLFRRRWLKRRSALPSQLFSEYDPQQVFLGEGGEAGVRERRRQQELEKQARIQEAQMRPQPRLPSLLVGKPLDNETGTPSAMVDEPARTVAPSSRRWESERTPGLSSHPITSPDRLEDLRFSFVRGAGSSVSLHTTDSRRISGTNARGRDSFSAGSIFDPDNSMSEMEPRPRPDTLTPLDSVSQTARPRTMDSTISSAELLPRLQGKEPASGSSSSSNLPTALQKIQGWIEASRKPRWMFGGASGPGAVQSRFSGTATDFSSSGEEKSGRHTPSDGGGLSEKQPSEK
ncbi:uncharacterized protein PV09_04087 [Verruconis gallopava]|uniref:Mid2 domain-containing protein n=1 Tax=Verruconis gallopava TaxID=253628 RepID=A0A0D1YW55_9PEZI|nr:uncharacterized protein PV09_04087 [Verruconis gallopava]KIW04917.1 hypothetical protein PV09_04087 [Verruconis gallopava]